MLKPRQGVGRWPLGQRDFEDAVGDAGFEIAVIEAVAEPQPQLVVALHPFEVEGLPVDTYEMSFARRHGEVGAAGGDFHSGGGDARHVDDELQRIGVIPAVEIRLTEVGGHGPAGAVASRGL